MTKHTVRSYLVLGFAAYTTLAILAHSSLAGAATVAVDPAKGKVEFHAVGRPSMIKINGEGQGPKGLLDLNSTSVGTKVTGDLTFDMKTLSSGISMRDEHMKDKYLEVGKFPESKLHLTSVTLPEKWSAASPATKEGKFKGDLTLHGVTKPVDGTFEVSGDAQAMTVKVDFTVQIDQFGVEIPKYLGITVKNDVPVQLTMNDLKPSAEAATPKASK